MSEVNQAKRKQEKTTLLYFANNAIALDNDGMLQRTVEFLPCGSDVLLQLLADQCTISLHVCEAPWCKHFDRVLQNWAHHCSFSEFPG